MNRKKWAEDMNRQSTKEKTDKVNGHRRDFQFTGNQRN